jgi:hypothetical protein
VTALKPSRAARSEAAPVKRAAPLPSYTTRALDRSCAFRCGTLITARERTRVAFVGGRNDSRGIRCNWKGVSNNSRFMLRWVQPGGVGYDNTPSLARKNSSLGQSK